MFDKGTEDARSLKSWRLQSLLRVCSDATQWQNLRCHGNLRRTAVGYDPETISVSVVYHRFSYGIRFVAVFTTSPSSIIVIYVLRMAVVYLLPIFYPKSQTSTPNPPLFYVRFLDELLQSTDSHSDLAYHSSLSARTGPPRYRSVSKRCKEVVYSPK